MGRQLKRVPLDFKWPINETWSGYLNPHARHKCGDCEGEGWSKEYLWMRDEWYGWNKPEVWAPNPYRSTSRYNTIAWNNNVTEEDIQVLLDNDRLWDFTRRPLNDEQREIVRKKVEEGGNSWLPFNNGYVPTPEEVNEWNLKGMGHDSSNCYYIVKARLEREGKPMHCPSCNGECVIWQHPRAKEYYESWEDYDPPKGDGYQLWENTSEGSPLTPVFETLEELCVYCEIEKVSHFGSYTASKEQWFEMLSDGDTSYKRGNMIFN